MAKLSTAAEVEKANGDIPAGYREEFGTRGFTLIERIGSGLSGTVYRARQETLGRDIAIKVFDNPVSKADPKLRKRFEHEAKLLALVRHPSLPVVLTRGEVKVRGGKIPYTALEFIEGYTLCDVIKQEAPLSLDRGVRYAVQVLGALGTAHAKKIVHRDVKPSNIMVDLGSDHVVLIDFSIGVSLDALPGCTRVTAEGNQPGTTEYMAPEQRSGAEVDVRADIYSFGIVLFEMLTGSSRVRLGMIDADLKEYPAEIRAAISTACQPDKNRRFETAFAFRRALAPFDGAIRLREQPEDAICLKLTCPGANWSQFGYYKGPRIVRNTRANRCDDCGGHLVYPCEKCREPFNDKRFCANCGNEQYPLPPECENCGSHLKSGDMDADTAAKGCDKCRRKGTAPGSTPAISFEDPFDDPEASPF